MGRMFPACVARDLLRNLHRKIFSSYSSRNLGRGQLEIFLVLLPLLPLFTFTDVLILLAVDIFDISEPC